MTVLVFSLILFRVCIIDDRRAKRANLDSLLLRVCDSEKELERVILEDPSTCDVQGRTTREGGE